MAKHGEPGSRLVVTAARSIAARAAALDREAAAAAVSSSVGLTGAGAGMAVPMGAAAGAAAGGGAAPGAAASTASAVAVAAAGAATLRRLVFNLVALADHHAVPDLWLAAEEAVMSATSVRVILDGGGGVVGGSDSVKRGRMAAYDDLVAGVLSCGDYARKSAMVEWALRLRSRI